MVLVFIVEHPKATANFESIAFHKVDKSFLDCGHNVKRLPIIGL